MIIRKRSLLKDVLEALPDPELSKGALPLLQKLREAAREIEAESATEAEETGEWMRSSIRMRQRCSVCWTRM